MVPVGYTWLRQTFGLLKSELEHESYLGSRASLTHQKNGRKTQTFCKRPVGVPLFETSRGE